MYDLEEFLQGAMMNCPIILVTDELKKVTYVNEVDGKGKKFTFWDIQNGKLVLYLDK